jgi:hypothetical protein
VTAKKILFVNLYGIGNCILSTPTISALKSLGFVVTVLVTRSRCSDVAFKDWAEVNIIYYNDVPVVLDRAFSFVLWAHPVRQGVVFGGEKSLCVNPNPQSALPYHFRFTRHEVIEVLDLARRLGYSGGIPAVRAPYRTCGIGLPARSVAIGIGYLKNGKWNQKHWGNTNFVDLCNELKKAGFNPVLFGDEIDNVIDGQVIEKEADVTNLCGKLALEESLGTIARCIGYIGNDTGAMHAAAAFGMPTLGVFCATDPVKNAPWGQCGRVLAGRPNARTVWSLFCELVRNK